MFQAETREKTLLILDGSRKAIEIIATARQLGVRTLVTDFNSPEDSPAKLFADAHFNVSTTDIDGVCQLIQDHDVDGVLPGFSDRWLPTYAKICALSGLPSYATEDVLRLFTDKARYKELLHKHGIPTVRGYSVQQASNGEIPFSDFPLLVKPAGGSGSRGIRVCSGPSDIQNAIEFARQHSYTGDVLIEKYLPGEEATAYWLFKDGNYYLTTIANRHMHTFAGGTARLPIAYTHPSHLVPRYLQEVAPKVENMLNYVGVKNGIMFMQGLVDQGTFRTYDIGYRPTPTQEYKILEELCGYNPLRMLIHFAVHGSMGEPDIFNKVDPLLPKGYGYNVSTLAMPGMIGKLEGLEDVAGLPGVISISTALAAGDTLPPEALGQLRQIVVRTIGTTTSAQELLDRLNKIPELISIWSDEGTRLAVTGRVIDEVYDQVLPKNERW